MEWLQLQPAISRPESGFVEDAAATHTIRSADDENDYAEPNLVDSTRRSLRASNKGKSKWKFLSRKSSWRSL